MYRQQRVGDLLLGFLAQEIRLLGDDRLTFLTLTAVDISPDLKHASIYWSIPLRGHHLLEHPSEKAPQCSVEKIEFPTPSEVELVESILKDHRKYLKKRIGEELNLRYTPDLRFRYDSSEEQGYKIDQLLTKI